MRVTVELSEPDVAGHTAAHLILRDPETNLPVAEIAVRGAGYIVLTEEERLEIIKSFVGFPSDGDWVFSAEMDIPDREGGYHTAEPPLWRQIAEEQAAKRGVPSRVTKVGGKKIRVPQSLEDIDYPEGCEFLPLTQEEIAAGQTLGIVRVPSRKGEDADGKRHRRACKRARAQQFAFLAAQKDPSSVEDGEEDADGGED